MNQTIHFHTSIHSKEEGKEGGEGKGKERKEREKKVESPSTSNWAVNWDKKERKSWEIVRAFLPYIWPKGENALKFRVVTALCLLVGAKILNVQVPYIFKQAIDLLNASPDLLVAIPVSVLIGCLFLFNFFNLEKLIDKKTTTKMEQQEQGVAYSMK